MRIETDHEMKMSQNAVYYYFHFAVDHMRKGNRTIPLYHAHYIETNGILQNIKRKSLLHGFFFVFSRTSVQSYHMHFNNCCMRIAINHFEEEIYVGAYFALPG